ncbi:MAG: hypothetical protein ACREA0_22250 [bacterium]
MKHPAFGDSIVSGGLEFPACWVRCRATASFKPGEVLVRIEAEGAPDPLPFFVDSELVDPSELRRDQEVEARVKVMFLGHEPGRLVVEVPGEPVSFGPRILVRESLWS